MNCTGKLPKRDLDDGLKQRAVTFLRQEQKSMQNSAQQLRNVIDAFEVVGEVPNDPVLLIDDVVDSRWTLTVVSWLLLKNGSGPVYPFALASATVGGS
ncbi:MAG TPA: hypothetical protein VLE20_03980 [Blastocatellia bacterium]|nr:hypothetical protein [Blastocatellia bacterium]